MCSPLTPPHTVLFHINKSKRLRNSKDPSFVFLSICLSHLTPSRTVCSLSHDSHPFARSFYVTYFYLLSFVKEPSLFYAFYSFCRLFIVSVSPRSYSTFSPVNKSPEISLTLRPLLAKVVYVFQSVVAMARNFDRIN